MTRDWRIVVRFAAAGLGFAIMFFAFDRFEVASTPQGLLPLRMRVAIVTLCPGCLVLATLDVDLKAGTRAFNEFWLIIALANSAVYATIGAAFVALRRLRKKPPSG